MMNWKKERLKTLGWLRSAGVNKLIDLKQKEVRLINYMDVYRNHQITDKIEFQKVTAKDSEIVNANVVVGDVLFTPSSEKPTDIGHAGVVMQNLKDTVYSYHLVRFRFHDIAKFDPLFLSYLLNTSKAEKHFVTRATGTTRYTLSLKDFQSLEIEYPEDVKEQKAIATILSKVDEAIKATENSIKAADKLKKSLMQNLLTGKLKPDGTWRKEDEFYKDEKFGNVPVGWVVKAIGDNSHCEINPNYKFTKGREYDFIPMEAVNDPFGGVTSPLEKRVIDGGGYTRYKKGDIIFAKITPCTENGKVALIRECETEIGFASTEFIVFSPKEIIDSLFFYYLLSSSSVHMLAVSLMEGTTGRQRVPWKVFKNRIFAPIPTDVNEQRAVAALISSVETQNQSRSKKIESLKRVKKSLMQNLLTGKVRVDLSKFENVITDEAI